MNILECDDNHLRQLIFEKEKVIVKFIDETCPICQRLAPTFTKLASQPLYSDVTFVRMHASQNPVSSKEVKQKGTPFFATYLNGTLQECGLLSSEEEIKQLLQRLN
ncbi:thiol-disulfide isomerase/thioredoxin [Pontibacter aydingkolensis]|uniref:Thioredoxin family protein n=1 Tax=Pontibacter aydingkolensis TaxID=1911536 RepID=A0ABS7CQA5_9BACT|nr:thioredoxin family protein [Pontibacter aydingkolensis]MBW7466027.1 thioredoxin family protein [Pontibacter aydingkolensis]